MTRLCLAFHCHQPAGNFSWVFEEAMTHAYRPFLDVLERHPSVRVIFHYSGALLDWLEREHPDFLKRLGALVRRNQAQFLGGGYYEPILTLIPERDALGQLTQMTKTLARLGLDGGKGTAGAWLPERIWEPQLPSLLASAGIRYTIVDDHHLKLAGVAPENQFGYYLTEDRGHSLALFPSSKILRYLVPFKPVDEMIETLRQLDSDRPRVVVLADDGEKFGLWPGTHPWVYQEGWLEAFFQALERNRDWLKLMTFRECLSTLPALGRLYLAGGSYEEMCEWSGGTFRNFLVKYSEADAMHKKMLWISNRLEEARSRSRPDRLGEATQHLYMAQSNDSYWHGVFGGLYLRHLRRSVYQHLLAAERILDGVQKSPVRAHGLAVDIDADQKEEFLLRSRALTLTLDADHGGQLVELSDKEACVNLLDTLTRRPEPYHERLRNRQTLHAVSSSAPATIHEHQEESGAHLVDSCIYDSYRRAGLMDHLLSPDASLRAFAAGSPQEMGDFVEGSYEGKLSRAGVAQVTLTRTGRLTRNGSAHPFKLTKRIGIQGNSRSVTVSYRLTNLSEEPVAFLFGSEINLNLKDAHVNRIGEADGLRRFAVTDPASRLFVSWMFTKPARLWHFPLETVSDSERGMERNYQGVCLTWLWPLTLSSRESWSVRWHMEIAAADEKP